MAVERKEKIIRVLQILQTTDEKTPINATQIIDKLENEYVIGKTERRSIYRDVRMLQYCGYAIKQAKDRKLGWYMEKHAFDDWEIKIMMDSVCQAKCVSVEEAVNIRKKLLELTSDRGRSRFSHMMMPASNTESHKRIGDYIEIMLEAMYMHKKIRFQYTEINDKMEKVLRREGKIYKLNLYTIYWDQNNYYLIGAHDNHDALTSYRLDRIENLTMSDEKAIPAKDKIGANPEMVIQEFIQKSVNHFYGDKIRIVVEYEPGQITNAILYDFAGENVLVRKDKSGKCTAAFTKLNSVTLTGWLMQYANMFRVVSPKKLRDDVAAELKKALEGYGK